MATAPLFVQFSLIDRRTLRKPAPLQLSLLEKEALPILTAPAPESLKKAGVTNLTNSLLPLATIGCINYAIQPTKRPMTVLEQTRFSVNGEGTLGKQPLSPGLS
jgi:hypothetical protein